MRRLEGKVAVISGTGNGQARTAALRFAEEGAKIVGCDINEETAAETLRLVREAGGEMECLFPHDLSVEQNAVDFIAHAVNVYGGIDILYNNAMSMRMGTPAEMRLEDWNFTLTNTLTIHWLTTKHAIPHLKARGGGSILFTASVAGLNFGTGFSGNLPHLVAYSVAKAGLSRLATILAVDLTRHNIRVNTISPSFIDTPITENVYGKPGSDLYRAATDMMLVDYIGAPDQVVETALFLVSDVAKYITGANVVVDGGLTASGGAGGPDPQVEDLMQEVLGGWLSVDDPWTPSVKSPTT